MCWYHYPTPLIPCPHGVVFCIVPVTNGSCKVSAVVPLGQPPGNNNQVMDSSRATCHSIQTAFTGWLDSLIPINISWLTAKEILWNPSVFHSYTSAFMKEFVISDIPYQIRNLLVLDNVRYMIYQCLQLEKKNLLHYLHNRHLKLVDVTFDDNCFIRALSCWWIRRGAICWSANTVFPNGSESLAPVISWLTAIEYALLHDCNIPTIDDLETVKENIVSIDELVPCTQHLVPHPSLSPI